MRTTELLCSNWKWIKLLGCVGLLMLLADASLAQRRAGLCYVSNERDGTISVIDTASDRVVRTIQIGGRLRGIHLSANGRRLYVAMASPMNQRVAGADKIVEINPATGRIVAKHNVGSDPEQFAVSRDGARLYVSNEDANTASVADLKTGDVLVLAGKRETQPAPVRAETATKRRRKA